MEKMNWLRIILVIFLKLSGIHLLRCGDPGPIYNGTILGKTHFNTGGFVRYKCNKCYHRRGPSMIYCSKWGHWSSQVPECKPNKCPDLKLDNGKVLIGKSYGFEYHFTCNAPMVLAGPKVIKCTCYGRWSSKPPACRVPVQTKPPPTKRPLPKGHCPPPEQLYNGNFYAARIGDEDSNAYQAGDRIYFLCNLRFRLIGPHYRECGFDSKWDGDHPYCQKKSDRDTEPDNVLSIFAMIESCTKPFPPINGELTGNDHVGGFIHFQCRSGFALVGAERALCQRNGRWSEETPKCKPACKVHKCPVGKYCELDMLTRRPVCRCQPNNDCSGVHTPMCGDDGRTYNNKCEMKLAACRTNKNITKLHDGECRPRPVCHIAPTNKCEKAMLVPLYRYNVESGECELRNLATCHRSGFNGFRTKEGCMQTCSNVCKLPKDGGLCKSGRPSIRWTYVERIQNCRRFRYSGCYGNGNNFATVKECYTFCHRNQVRKKRIH